MFRKRFLSLLLVGALFLPLGVPAVFASDCSQGKQTSQKCEPASSASGSTAKGSFHTGMLFFTVGQLSEVAADAISGGSEGADVHTTEKTKRPALDATTAPHSHSANESQSNVLRPRRQPLTAEELNQNLVRTPINADGTVHVTETAPKYLWNEFAPEDTVGPVELTRSELGVSESEASLIERQILPATEPASAGAPQNSGILDPPSKSGAWGEQVLNGDLPECFRFAGSTASAIGEVLIIGELVNEYIVQRLPALPEQPLTRATVN